MIEKNWMAELAHHHNKTRRQYSEDRLMILRMFGVIISFIEQKLSKLIWFCVSFICILTVAIEEPLLAQTEITPADKAQTSDSVQVQHKKYRSRSTVEAIVSFPGVLVYLPLKLTFKGFGAIVSYVDEKKVVQKTRDFLTSDDGRRGVLPTYSDRTGGGIKFFQKGLLTPKSKLSMSITAGLRSRRRYQLRLRRVQLWHVLSADLLARHKFLPDEPFFGIGPDTDFEDDRSNFAHKQTTAQVAVGANLDERFTAKVMVGFEVNRTSPGRNKRHDSTTDVETSEPLPGLETGVNLARFQVEVRHDSRNRPVRPRSGGVELLRVGFFQESGGDQFGFWKATLDFSRQFHLFYNRTLIFRVAGEITEPFSDRDIPFYYLSELGRKETIRGFQRGRFRDLDMLFGSAEYRYPIWQIMDAFLFVDAGQVAHDIFNDFSISDLQVGYGVGIQIWGREGVISSLAVGKSKDGFRVYFGLNREL